MEVEPEVKTEPHHDVALAPMTEETYEEGYDYGEYAPESVEYEGAMVEHSDSGKGEKFFPSFSFVMWCVVVCGHPFQP